MNSLYCVRSSAAAFRWQSCFYNEDSVVGGEGTQSKQEQFTFNPFPLRLR